MRKNHLVKEEKVNQLVKKMQESYSFVSVSYSALGIKSSEWLRKEVKKSQGEIQMVSNNVLRRALQKITGNNDEMRIVGQNFILLVKSQKIFPLKLLSDLIKKYNLLKLGVVFCDNIFLSSEQRDYLSSWLEKEDVFSKLVYLLNYPIVSLIFTLKAIESKK